MTSRKLMWSVLAVALAVVSCNDPTLAPDAPLTPSFHREGDRHRTVVVDPRGRHDATTIQAGIDLVTPGGRVQVKAGTYNEALVIAKGLTLEAYDDGHDDHHRDRGEHHGEVVIAPSGAPLTAIEISTSQPVTIREVTVHFGGANGIRGVGVVDLTVEHATVVAVNPPLGVSLLVAVVNDAPTTGRARLAVRNSFIDGAVPFADSPTPTFPQSFGIRAAGDVDALLDGNVIRRTGGACINVQARNDLGGHMQADITGNDVDECYPIGRAGAITVGAANTNVPSATRPITATGVVNIVGNTIRNSFATCLSSTAIVYALYGGRIEHNRILGVVQPCAVPTVRGAPGAIFVGDQRDFFPPATPVVRFNDIVGNAQAGVRVNRNQTTPLDLRCNYWGSTGGPSGTGLTGTGDAIVVEAGAATPVSTPFARGRVARHRHDGHHGHHNRGGHDREGCHLEYSLWSEPVNLGAIINTAATEQNPSVSPDELSLYFGSSRPGGYGLTDIYVSRRASRRSPWGTPVNLGPIINTSGSEIGPNLSSDGRMLFFQSSRAGGHGAIDIWVSSRADRANDFAWEAPVNLGPYVNTAGEEGAPEYVSTEHGAILYFNRRPVGGLYDIYSVPLTRNGLPREVATPIAELNTSAQDVGATVSSDGLELIVASDRPGSLGPIIDLWVSTRPGVDDPWSTPTNLGPPVNTVFNDRAPSLSGHDRVLIFTSQRPGGFGSDDLWMSTRTRIGR